MSNEIIMEYWLLKNSALWNIADVIWDEDEFLFVCCIKYKNIKHKNKAYLLYAKSLFD